MQQKKGKKPEMILYNGRQVPAHLFKTNVYYVDKDDSICKRLAKSFDEFKKLLISGQYFETREQAKASIKPSPAASRKKKE